MARHASQAVQSKKAPAETGGSKAHASQAPQAARKAPATGAPAAASHRNSPPGKNTPGKVPGLRRTGTTATKSPFK